MHKEITILTLFAGSKFVTNRNQFQVIAETRPTGQHHYEAMTTGSHLFFPEDKDKLDFSESVKLFMPKSQPPE